MIKSDLILTTCADSVKSVMKAHGPKLTGNLTEAIIPNYEYTEEIVDIIGGNDIVASVSTSMLGHMESKPTQQDLDNLYKDYGVKVNSDDLQQARVLTVEFGKNWTQKTNPKNMKANRTYNYGMLLNDKRIIKNRESKNKEKRLSNREKRAYQNTRNILVIDEKGRNQRVSDRQYRHHISGQKQWKMVGVDTTIPITKIPQRVNVHYHYLDEIYDLVVKDIAHRLNGKIHEGNYIPHKTTRASKKLPTEVLEQARNGVE